MPNLIRSLLCFWAFCSFYSIICAYPLEWSVLEQDFVVPQIEEDLDWVPCPSTPGRKIPRVIFRKPDVVEWIKSAEVEIRDGTLRKIVLRISGERKVEVSEFLNSNYSVQAGTRTRTLLEGRKDGYIIEIMWVNMWGDGSDDARLQVVFKEPE